MVSGDSVRILRSRSVSPATRDGIPPRHQLTPFDGGMRFALYQKRVLFFANVGDFAGAVASLEESLRAVLVRYKPLCGRMVVGGGGDGDEGVGLEIDCSGELSVRFSEAETAVKLEELGNFEPSEFCDSLSEIGCEPRYPWDPELPLLLIQVTRFGCGGLGIGAAFSHQVMDGVSAWNFMNSWAERARTRGTSPLPEVTCYGYKAPKLSVEEMQSRLEAVGFNWPSSDRTPEEETPIASNDPNEEVDRTLVDKNGDEPAANPTLNFFQGKLGVKKLTASKEAIQSLKSAAAPGLTSFELLCADYWRKMVAAAVAAELLDQSDDCYFMILLNCRGRVRSIPSSYFGNAVVATRATAKAGELLAEDGLGSIAQLLHDAIRRVDEQTAEGCAAAVNEFMQRMFGSNTAKSRPVVKPGQSVLVVSSPRHPVYECDFGFGRPVGVTFGMNDLGDSKLYLFPAADGKGGVDVAVCMRAEALDKLA